MARVTKIKVHGGILQQPDRRNRMKKEEFEVGNTRVVRVSWCVRLRL
jgi:hypothetical protein